MVRNVSRKWQLVQLLDNSFCLFFMLHLKVYSSLYMNFQLWCKLIKNVCFILTAFLQLTAYEEKYSVPKTLDVSTTLRHFWKRESDRLSKTALLSDLAPCPHLCHYPYTVKHVLIECPDFIHIRNLWFHA